MAIDFCIDPAELTHCEAMVDDSLSMMMARILTGRPGFVSDPALDTSKNQIVYAHCVGTTKVFGPEGKANGYRIRTLHNRDPRGACAESLMPAGYMTTSFRTNFGRKQLIVHRAKAVGTATTGMRCIFIARKRSCRNRPCPSIPGCLTARPTSRTSGAWRLSPKNCFRGMPFPYR